MFALRGLANRFLPLGRPIPGIHFGGLDTLLDFSVLESCRRRRPKGLSKNAPWNWAWISSVAVLLKSWSKMPLAL
jgi:hypothetical protein